MSKDRDNYQIALSLQKEAKYKEALEVAVKIAHPAFRACILVDCGYGIGKPQIIREGIALFEEILNAKSSSISRASLLYNIGNGYSHIYEIRHHRGVKVIAPNDDDLRKAKRAYRDAISETKGNTPKARSQLLVNYGNCLSALGRNFEAINAYNDALNLEPRNGMAAGNLGIELNKVARITGKYTHHYLLAAYHALSQACGSEMHLEYGNIEVRRGIENARDQIKKIIDAHKDGIEPLKEVVLPAKRTIENRYIRYCLKNQLFLNAWVGDPNVSPAMSDEISFGPITTSKSDSATVPELINILNEIKEAYATARYLLFVSRTKSKILDNISGLTSYFDYKSKNIHGIYVGLCKSAYMRSFDVLDKIARIANVYFKVGNRRDYFWDVFAERQSRGETHEERFVARPAIVCAKNFSLFALSDLCIDYFESEHVGLKTFDSRRN